MTLAVTTYPNQGVPVVTNVALAGVALPLVAGVGAAGFYTVTTPVTTPAMQVTDLSNVTIELTLVMATTGTLRVYGMGCHYSINVN